MLLRSWCQQNRWKISWQCDLAIKNKRDSHFSLISYPEMWPKMKKSMKKLIFLLLWPIDWFVKKPYRCHVSGHHSCPLKKAMAILTNIVKISPNHGKLKWNTALDNPRNGLQTFIKLSLSFLSNTNCDLKMQKLAHNRVYLALAEGEWQGCDGEG